MISASEPHTAPPPGHPAEALGAVLPVMARQWTSHCTPPVRPHDNAGAQGARSSTPGPGAALRSRVPSHGPGAQAGYALQI